jgi:hypothetical protein
MIVCSASRGYSKEAGKMKRRGVFRIAPSCCALLLLLGMAGLARAQYVVGAKAGLIQFIEGRVFLDDTLLEVSKSDSILMENSQTLRTEEGRAELLLNPNSVIRLGGNSSLWIEQNRLQDICLVLQKGSAIVEIVEEIKGGRIVVRLSNGWAEMKKAGLYRFEADSSEIQVWSGELLAANTKKQIAIKGIGKIRLSEDLKPELFPADFLDKLHVWAALRSFELFNTNMVTRRQGHWQPTSNWGWMRSPSYRISCFSAQIAAAQKQFPAGDVALANEEAARRGMGTGTNMSAETMAAEALQRAVQQQQQQQLLQQQQQQQQQPPPPQNPPAQKPSK